jgi:hypothetical protein
MVLIHISPDRFDYSPELASAHNAAWRVVLFVMMLTRRDQRTQVPFA